MMVGKKKKNKSKKIKLNLLEACADTTVTGDDMIHILGQQSRKNQQLRLRDNHNWSPLHHAVYKNSVRKVMVLLNEKSLDIRAESWEGETALFIACGNDSTDIEIVKLLIKFDKQLFDFVNNEEVSPLHRATQINRLDIVKLLIENGAPVNYQDLDGETALFYAVRELHLDIILYLLYEADCDPNIRNSQNLTALSIAVYVVTCFDKLNESFARIIRELVQFTLHTDEHNLYDINETIRLIMIALEANCMHLAEYLLSIFLHIQINDCFGRKIRLIFDEIENAKSYMISLNFLMFLLNSNLNNLEDIIDKKLRRIVRLDLLNIYRPLVAYGNKDIFMGIFFGIMSKGWCFSDIAYIVDIKNFIRDSLGCIKSKQILEKNEDDATITTTTSIITQNFTKQDIFDFIHMSKLFGFDVNNYYVRSDLYVNEDLITTFFLPFSNDKCRFIIVSKDQGFAELQHLSPIELADSYTAINKKTRVRSLVQICVSTIRTCIFATKQFLNLPDYDKIMLFHKLNLPEICVDYLRLNVGKFDLKLKIN